MTTWWTALYDDLLADVLLDGKPDDTAETVDFLIDALELAPGDRVFDQCSGTGRLAVPLAARGFVVEAVEQAALYVERASVRAYAELADDAPAPRFVVGDAFAYTPDAPCRGAFNWWTSFGYLAADDANLRMLQRAFDALAPGGRFALDFLNVPSLLRHFRPHEVTRRATPRGEIVLHRDSLVDLAAGTLHKHWTFLAPDGRHVERASAVRLYMPDQLVALLGRAGFTELELVGSTAGEPLSIDSPRCIALGARP